MNSFNYLVAAAVLSFIALTTGCGGGDTRVANNGGGIGGTGITATGTIDGFGSIFVNGIEFETDSSSVVVDSNSASEADLRLGMVVTVVGTVHTDGISGTASTVEFDDDVQGPVTTITVSMDGTQKTLSVMGIDVLVDQTSTTFDDVSFSSLAVNDVIEVSGFFDIKAVLHASRIEKKQNFVENSSEIEIKGLISNLTDNQFTLNTFTIIYSGADLSDIPNSMLSDGMNVEVKGTLSGTTITATHIEIEESRYGESAENVSLEGLITDYVDNSSFKVSGQSVNAENAQFEPSGLQLKNGLKIEVEGAIVNSVLIAKEIEARSGELKFAAKVQSVNVNDTPVTITLEFASGAAGALEIVINNQTELGDETDTFNPFTSADIRIGDFLRIKALSNGEQIIATELRLENADDEFVRGPVVSFITEESINLLGITYSTVGADFENSLDEPIDADVFFSQLNIGDKVKIKDDFPADGIADEVEFED